MSGNLDAQIDALFAGDAAAPADEAGCLARLAHALQRWQPRRLWLARRNGQMLATWTKPSNSREAEPAWQAALTRALSELKSDATWFHMEHDAGAALFAFTPDGDPEAPILGGELSAGGPPDSDLPALLASYAALCDQYLHAEAGSAQAAVRVRHLAAERDTLRDSYAQIMASALLEREERLQEQKRHVEQLEEEVARRSAALRDALQHAEQASRAKSDFLANMSHEIRTPMTAILGFADLLLEEAAGNDKAIGWLNVVRRNGRHLLDLINDILDISKIEAGKLSPESIACSPHEILHGVIDLMRPRAAERGLELRLRLDAGVPSIIHSDPVRLRQVLLNLVSNAVKFTQTGSVAVNCLLSGAPGRGQRLCFEVIDTGVGIEANKLERIFEPFTQADASTTRQFGGTGLGLTICRCLARLLGGAIEVRSTPGRGSTFTFWLELASFGAGDSATSPAAPVAAPALAAKPLAGLHLLLAEDSPDVRALLGLILQRAGAALTSCENGQEAVERASAAWRQGQPFAAVLMDMQMPVLDGYGAARQLRSLGYTGPIIALTAHAMAGDVQACLDAGCDAHAAKPVNADALLRLILEKIAQPARPTPSSTVSDILADDPSMLEIIHVFLENLPRQVERLRGGQDNGDADAVRGAAHQLKGCAASVGFPRITHVAHELERALQQGEALNGLQHSVRELLELCEQALDEGKSLPDSAPFPSGNGLG